VARSPAAPGGCVGAAPPARTFTHKYWVGWSIAFLIGCLLSLAMAVWCFFADAK